MTDRADSHTRRQFLAVSGAAALTAALPVRGQGQVRTRVAMVGTGIRGTGMWGRDIAEGYSDVVEFVGLSDINPGRLEYGRQYIGVECPTFTDFDEMMRTTNPEVLIVTTMDSTHDEFIVNGMEAGCNIVTEKPLTTDEEKCQRILDAQARIDHSALVQRRPLGLHFSAPALGLAGIADKRCGLPGLRHQHLAHLLVVILVGEARCLSKLLTVQGA